MEEISAAVSEETERSEEVTHDFFRSVLRFGPVLPKQQQTGPDAPTSGDDGEITGKLWRGAGVASRIDALYGQESHVGDQ